MKDKLFNFRVTEEWLDRRRREMERLRPGQRSLSSYIMEMVEIGEIMAPIMEIEKGAEDGE